MQYAVAAAAAKRPRKARSCICAGSEKRATHHRVVTTRKQTDDT